MKPRLEPINLLPHESFRLLRWDDDNVTAVEVLGADGKSYRRKGVGDIWHCHPGMELVLITHGAGTRLLGDSITAFEAIDLVLVGSNLPHHWRASGRLSGYTLQFDFSSDHAFWKLEETMDLLPLWSSAQRGIQFSGTLAAEVADLILAMPQRGGIGRLGLLLLILEKLQQAAPGTWQLLSQKSFPSSSRQSSYRGIQKAIDLLLSHFHEDLSFADLLKQSCMSKATFERQFNKLTGKTPTRFLTEVRIDNARRQLIETDLTIGQIALASGFNNLSHFINQFRAIHGETPSAFRRRTKMAPEDKTAR